MTKKRAGYLPDASATPTKGAPSAESPPTSSNPAGTPIVLSRQAVNEIIVGLLQTVSIQKEITQFLTHALSASVATSQETKND